MHEMSKLNQIILEKKDLERELKVERQKSFLEKLTTIIEDARNSAEIPIVTKMLSVSSVEELKEFGDIIRSKMPNGAALLGSAVENKTMLVCVVGDVLIKDKSWNAGTIIKDLSKKLGGGGGGRPHMATAGLKNALKITEAFQLFKKTVDVLYGETTKTLDIFDKSSQQ